MAITLLSFDLAVPEPGRGTALGQLRGDWPAFAAYVISFFTIGIIWVNHHALILKVALVNRTLLYLNMLLLMFVVAIPFATSTMAGYLTRGGPNAEVAAALYSLAFEAMAISFTLLFEWTLQNEDRLHAPPAARRWEARLRFYGGQSVYLASIGVAFASPMAALALSALTAVYYMTPVPHVTGHQRPRRDRET